MTVRQTLLNVFQTVLFVALFGCFTANGGPVVKDSNLTPLVVSSTNEQPTNGVSQQTEQPEKESFRNDSHGLSDDNGELGAQVGDLEETIHDLKKDVKAARRHITFLYVLLFATLGGAYYLNKKRKGLQTDVDSEQNLKLQHLEDRLNNKIDDRSSRLQQEMEDIRKAGKAQAQAAQNSTNGQSTQGNRYGNSGGNNTQTSSQGTQTQKGTSNDTCKYFMLQESNGQMLVRDRNLKSEPNGWFSMEINGNRATYDINPKMVSVILADIATLKLCAKDFETKPNAKGIQTVKKGTMQREGQAWVVTDKISIKLV